MFISISIGRGHIEIEREIFETLFQNSVVSQYADVRAALEGEPITLDKFLGLTRKAEIPYPLFFATKPVVYEQVRIKTQKLMKGFTKSSFSMHSRHAVEVRDVELIVKDLLRKQELLRANDLTLTNNKIVGMLRQHDGTVADQARHVREALGLSRTSFRDARSKSAAVELFISHLESNQVLVSRSAKNHMPQVIPNYVKFSGITIRDKKVPFIFLASGDEGEHLEASGRKLFTLALLTILIADGTFTPVNYDGHTKEESSPREYQLAAELLMPADEFVSLNFPNLEVVKAAADEYRVTPSAMAMRAFRLGRIPRVVFQEYMDALKTEYANRPKPRMSNARPENALAKYNGVECSKRMLAMLDAGSLNQTEFRRVVLLNRMPTSDIAIFRKAVN